eukprot:517257_1
MTESSFDDNIESNLNITVELAEFKKEESKCDYPTQDVDKEIENINIQSIQPKSDDYISCSNMAQCNVVKRIIHVLHYYEQCQSRSECNEDGLVLLYEYITNEYDQYTIPMFMEDWYHCKTIHLTSQTDYQLFKSNKDISCNKHVNCIYIPRHRRPRGRDDYDINKDIDFKNSILREQIDSIHAFVFHSSENNDMTDHEIECLLDDDTVETNSSDMKVININDTFTETKSGLDSCVFEEDLWWNKPLSIADCNVNQILYIMNHGHVLDNLNALSENRDQICIYIQENQLNGLSLIELQRKQFYINLSEYLNNKKLRSALGTLYNKITQIDVQKLYTIVEEKKESHHDVVNESNMQQKPVVNINKFTTSLINNESEKGALYSFGEQFRYTDHFRQMEHPLFVAAKYNSLKEELFEYFKRKNNIADKRTLLKKQLNIIDSMEPHLQSVLQKFVCKENIDDNDLDKLWYDTEQKDKHLIDKWIKHEEYNCQKLQDIISKIIIYPTDDGYIYYNFIFAGLLENVYKAINIDIVVKLQQILFRLRKAFVNEYDVKEKFDLLASKMKDDILELKVDYLEKLCNDDKKEITTKEMRKHNKEQKQYVQKFNNLFSVFQKQIFNGHLSQYFGSKNFFQTICNDLSLRRHAAAMLINGFLRKHIRYDYNKYINELTLSFYGDNTVNLKLPVSRLFLGKLVSNILFISIFNHKSAISNVLKVNKKDFYHRFLHIKCRKYPSLQKAAKDWSLNYLNPKQCSNDNTKRAQQLIDVFELEHKVDLDPYISNGHTIKTFYKNLAKTVIQEAINTQSINYVENRNKAECQHYIQKSNLKHDMISVKKKKAVWYHGMNEYHGIQPGTVMKQDHIVAMVCYTHIADLCTEFRATYRRKDDNETIENQKNRHSAFANMAKLLYEAFVFYASKESEVQILYHGMSIPLLFSTLYCSFDAPTSTTTASSVATEFGAATGIVIKFESSESSKYIRTLDMGLYTCFDRESEHLIFEARLHIMDIFVPNEKLWIGP